MEIGEMEIEKRRNRFKIDWGFYDEKYQEGYLNSSIPLNV